MAIVKTPAVPRLPAPAESAGARKLNNKGQNMAEIRHLISIEAPPQQVYAALATQAGLRSWWTADTTADDKAGGKAEFGFDKRGMTFRMTIEKLDPGRQVVWKCHGDNPEWVGTTLTWSIKPEGGGSLLRFTQSGWKDMTDMVATCNSTWGELMYRLKGSVEGKNPGPHWRE
ncbi:MAG TPA: SRPBCC domain-containing protein [Bradyrhizobium sp.]|jgi:uncharacterized protein YndB with AHSA1/START domain|nr:SRPBCC domain-containing protein [Bradyrhizobium sp.]